MLTFTVLSRAHEVLSTFTFLKQPRINKEAWRILKEMVKRESLTSEWCCSFDCGFKDWDIKKVIEHEDTTNHNSKKK